jgi:hypothetical protein
MPTLDEVVHSRNGLELRRGFTGKLCHNAMGVLIISVIPDVGYFYSLRKTAGG